MQSRRRFILLTILAVITLLLGGGGIQKGQASAYIIREGIFITIWGDGNQASMDSQITYYLSTAQHGNIQLIIPAELLISKGGPITLNRKAVIVEGRWQEMGKAMLVEGLALKAGETTDPDGIFGPQPWVSILCKFSDIPAEPNDLEFFQDMYSSQYPGLDHYWQQQSYDLANLEGSGAFGWYVLPHPPSY